MKLTVEQEDAFISYHDLLHAIYRLAFMSDEQIAYIKQRLTSAGMADGELNAALALVDAVVSENGD